MQTLDWILLGVVVLSMGVGAWRGLAVELLSLLNWALSFFAAQWFAPALALRLPMAGATEPIRQVVAFLILFVLAMFAGSILVWLVGKMFSLPALRPADRALGAVFGLMRGVLLLLVVALVIGMTPLKGDAWWTSSRVGGLAAATLKGLKPVLPQPFAGWLP